MPLLWAASTHLMPLLGVFDYTVTFLDYVFLIHSDVVITTAIRIQPPKKIHVCPSMKMANDG